MKKRWHFLQNGLYLIKYLTLAIRITTDMSQCHNNVLKFFTVPAGSNIHAVMINYVTAYLICSTPVKAHNIKLFFFSFPVVWIAIIFCHSGIHEQQLCHVHVNCYTLRALDHLILGPKWGPIPNAKKYVFSPIPNKKFPSLFHIIQIQNILLRNNNLIAIN